MWSRARLYTAFTVVAALVVAVLPGAPAVAAPANHAPTAPRDRSTPVHAVHTHYRTPPVMASWRRSAPTWPSGSTDVTLSSATQATVRAGSLPVSVGAVTAAFRQKLAGPSRTAPTPTQVRVQVASQTTASAAGINGVLVSATRVDAVAMPGPVHVSLSYASFADAYGGDWASRLKLVGLPACALTTPQLTGCRTQTPVAFSNNSSDRTLSTDTVLPAAAPAGHDERASSSAGQATPSANPSMVVLAAVAADAGGAGDFTATSLNPSGSWQAGGSSDGFNWSYPITLPEVPGGLVPQVSLSYSSQSLDGLSSATNNEASWIGDGWDYSPGYIERSYQSCHENPAGTTKTWDNCWSPNNQLTMSLNGSNSTLIKDDSTGAYHPEGDGNQKVQYLTGATNGAQNGEYFQITTDDGTRYIFGLNHLPGWASGNALTNSVWTEPVFAAASGQPCYNTTWASSWCQQAYRWNLDEVIDTHGDTIAYYYQTESNYYARNLGSTADTPYIRGGYLSKIAYGQRNGAQYTTSPAAQVTFNVNGRCDSSSSGCAISTLSASTASHWPDVPYDLNCANAASCTSQSPSFWSEYELTGIQTQALVGTTEAPADSWALSHSFPATGETSGHALTAPSLWLDSITRTGQDTSGGGSTAAITLNPISFSGTPLANRVDLLDGYPAITRHRLNTVTTETGETVSVDYSQAICSTCTPSIPSTNGTLSYPVYWTRPGQTDPSLDWFNKYIVRHVTEQDGTGGGPPGSNDTIDTSYTPVGAPAWHYNDNPLTPTSQRSWDQWRGYQGMTVSTGTAPDPIATTTYTYLRGMDGDTLPNSGVRHVAVGDSRGDPAVTDLDQYAGMTYETQLLNGSATVTDTISDPWTSPVTATHALTGGLPAQRAFHTGQASTRVYTPLASGSIQQTQTDNTHDSYGRVIQVNDQGDASTSADDLCTSTSYADNTSSGWILDLTDEAKTVSVSCDTQDPPTTATVSDKLAFYDNSATLGAVPTVGDATMAQQAQSYTGGSPNYLTTQTTTVDQYGRPLTTTDANSHKTTTGYSPASGAAPTSMTVTDPLKHVVTTAYDSVRSLPTKVTDPAGYVTSGQYDALGRLTAVWKPGSFTASPNLKYSYALNNNAPSVVDTYTLNENASGYRLSETLYDSMLRDREVQTQTPDGYRDITDTNYNTDGWQSVVTDPYFDQSAVSTTYVEADAGTVDAETGLLYDGAGRKTAAISYHLGTETWRTSYLYGGNFVTTIPPAGATASTMVTDARSRTTDLVQYRSGVPTDYITDPPADYTDTRSTSTPDGKPATETDPAGNTWTWSYNLLGEQTDAHDPDTGHTEVTYDNVGNPLTTTNLSDGNKKVTFTYDSDNRKTGAYDTTTVSTLSAANEIVGWTYDTVKAGLLTSTVSYSAGDVFTTAVRGYNGYGLPAAITTTLTGTDAALVPAAGYTIGYGYTNTGLPSGYSDPAEGTLPAENVTVGYDDFGEPTRLSSSGGASWTYVSAVGYNHYGQPVQYTMPTAGGNVWARLTYDPQTKNLTDIQTTDTTTSGYVDDLSYTFGNATVSKGADLLTQTVDKRNAGAITDTQCFSYDYADRLTQAWTATDNCAANPQPGNTSTIGGPVAPYWQSWTYDSAGAGLRATQTDHDLSGNTANDTTTTYHYPAPGGSDDQPHTLTSTTATGPAAGANTAAYGYDGSGNTTSVTGGSQGDQTLTWNNQDKLATDQTSAGTTTYVYDGGGNLLARRDPGTATLYLGDSQLVLNTSTQAVTGTRYYTLNGETVASRTNAGKISCLIPDRQGTDQLAIDTDAAQAVTRRQYLPFGQPRGSSGIFAGDKSYIGGNADSTTGLLNLGAREYSPPTGRFLSADPIFEAADPTQLNGYDYAGNNPVTHSDPTGLEHDAEAGNGMTYCDEHCGGPNSVSASGGNGNKTGGHPHQSTADDIDYPNQVYTKYLRHFRDQGSPNGDPGWAARQAQKATTKYFQDQCRAGVVAACHPEKLPNGPDLPVDIDPNAGSGCHANPVICALAIVLWVAGIFVQVDAIGDGGPGGSLETGLSKSTVKNMVRGAECESFDGTTTVLKADHSQIPIDQIKVGDKVETTDPTTGRTTVQTVTAVHIHLDRDLADLTVEAKHGSPSVLHTTQHHLFWDRTRHTWTETDQLSEGDLLLSPGSSQVAVAGVQTFTGLHVMYNLTVDTVHAYYVIVGDTPVLVHNEGGGGASGTIFRSGGYVFQIYANDHGPPHGHLKGDGYDIQIGQNGKPIDPNVELTAAQQRIVDDNLRTIRNSIGAKMSEYRLSGGCP